MTGATGALITFVVSIVAVIGVLVYCFKFAIGEGRRPVMRIKMAVFGFKIRFSLKTN